MTQIELIEKRRIWKAILVLLKAEIADESAGICFYIGEIVGHANIPRYNSKSDRAAWPEFFKYEPKTKYIERTHFQTPQPTGDDGKVVSKLWGIVTHADSPTVMLFK